MSRLHALSRSAGRVPAWAVAAAGAIAYLVVAPPGADLAAQTYRAELFGRAGFTLWDNGWYAGHHTPAYSILFPPLGALLGVRVAGALAAVAAAALFEALARRHWDGASGRAAALWFAAATSALLLTGRLTFVLGVATGVATLLALQTGRRALAAALAALTALASPVAALFVALAALAWGLAGAARPSRTRGVAIAVAALAPIALLAALFPEGGTFPFAVSAFWPALAATALVAALLPRDERVLRTAAVLYALGLVATFAVSSPLGGNVTRLGELAAGPIVLGALAGRRHPALVAALALPLAYWPLAPAIREVARATGDPSLRAAHHAPLLRFLQRQDGAFRVEIPFTRNHWEAAHVAPSVPLARGWERQLDRRHGALFYDGRIDADRYRAWLDEHAVAYVALSDVALDGSARQEAALVEAGLPYLRLVWRDAHWRVFAVFRPAPLASGVAEAIALTPDGFELRAGRAGDALVRVRHTRWWRVTAGTACIERDDTDGMTLVRVRAPGVVRVQARLTGASPRCP